MRLHSRPAVVSGAQAGGGVGAGELGDDVTRLAGEDALGEVDAALDGELVVVGGAQARAEGAAARHQAEEQAPSGVPVGGVAVGQPLTIRAAHQHLTAPVGGCARAATVPVVA